MSARQILNRIDHSVLRPETTEEEIIAACGLARRLGVACLCVNPFRVELAAQHLFESGVGISAAIGFPLGATTTRVKAGEAYNAVIEGATELDMVINIGALKSGDTEAVHEDIKAVVISAQEAAEEFELAPVVVKVILETCYLTDEQKRIAARLAAKAGADFVKTSTGFGPAGATVEDVRLLRAEVPARVLVKAAGGIRTLRDVLAMLEAGADRIGTSATAQIAQELGA